MRKNQYPESFESLIHVFQYFNSEKKAIKYMQWRRWQGKPVCPRCGQEKIYHFKDGKRFKCSGCKRQFTVTVGTPYENSKIPLRKWLIAICIVGSHKKGISSHQLARDIKVTQKTAWFMLHRIRYLLGTDNDQDDSQLEGVVSADETFVGGKNKNRHYDKKIKYTREGKGREFSDKTPIVGMMEAGGRVRTVVVIDVKRETLIPIIRKNVKSGSVLVTDEWRTYRMLNKEYHHEVVQHGNGRYMNDCFFTTNNIEGFWTCIKRMITGIYHYVSRKYLQLYAHEATFRYNTRSMSDGARLAYMLSLVNTRLRHKDLRSKVWV